MKAISLMQPWASLMALELKRIETRSWDTKYRGPLLIHSSKKVIPLHRLFDDLNFEQREFIFRALENAYDDPEKLPTGMIIAVCQLVETKPTESLTTLSWLEKACGDYAPGRFGWIIGEMKRLEPGIHAKGQLGLWNYDLEVSI